MSATRPATDHHHTVVDAHGDLDAYHVPALGERLRPLAESGTDIVLDLADVSFCGSAALELFVDVQEAARARGGSLTLTGLPRTMRRLLDVTDFGTLFPQDAVAPQPTA